MVYSAPQLISVQRLLLDGSTEDVPRQAAVATPGTTTGTFASGAAFATTRMLLTAA